MPRLVTGLMIWGAALYASLSIATMPGDWGGHAICGRWGCGPPLPAIVGCHVAWIVFLAPLVFAAANRSHIFGVSRRSIGRFLMFAATTALVAVLVRDYFGWYLQVGASRQAYWVHRLAFVVATTVEIPMVQVLLAGAWLARRPRQQSRGEEPNDAAVD